MRKIKKLNITISLFITYFIISFYTAILLRPLFRSSYTGLGAQFVGLGQNLIVLVVIIIIALFFTIFYIINKQPFNKEEPFGATMKVLNIISKVVLVLLIINIFRISQSINRSVQVNNVYQKKFMEQNFINSKITQKAIESGNIEDCAKISEVMPKNSCIDNVNFNLS